MVAYHEFVALTQSADSEDRGRAAHLAAMAYLGHLGPADEHAALYAALIGFLDDPSVKVRAALAYGLLHAIEAPRPILLALLQDAAVISRAVAQYSPALIDADLIGLARNGDLTMLLALAERARLSTRIAEAVIARGEIGVTLKLLARTDIAYRPETLAALAGEQGDNPRLRGALLARRELTPSARLKLVEAVGRALRETRIVKGAVAQRRLDRLMRNATDTALSAIGEREAVRAAPRYAAEMVESERVSTRVMLHAVVNGHVLFFADCVAELSEVSREKVFSILEGGGRPALNALFARCGLGEAVRNLLARLVFHARTADLADDVTARHFVVTALTEELIIEHGGDIPHELEEAFAYLSEQNVMLARKAARGVMPAFGGQSLNRLPAPDFDEPGQLALPAV
ncbi:hypothetical protein GCM10011321_06750 [Youhaiella tibetensis]|uniref:DUF2336 domain-containing protein n=1 Tax=Paradevosia tibetensis TaxID=1447062 RepID=A0A5B9DP34_9HYPH|nr:DUF2336 domain-containing protein [Youhaiella tibetensis]AKR56090.1 hypothetical protein XM25_09825 [Devosia sp. H5989]QEE21140.1 DUF2336 domain-containing protein [Youhaiella tibetensis]GGF17604.1 hypothetical protein GCM10011321_06750 [Youhaiella tibetensis]